MIDIKATTEFTGACRSTVCNDPRCEDRKRHFADIWINGVRFRTEANSFEHATALAVQAITAIGGKANT